MHYLKLTARVVLLLLLPAKPLRAEPSKMGSDNARAELLRALRADDATRSLKLLRKQSLGGEKGMGAKLEKRGKSWKKGKIVKKEKSRKILNLCFFTNLAYFGPIKTLPYRPIPCLLLCSTIFSHAFTFHKMHLIIFYLICPNMYPKIFVAVFYPSH